MKQKRAEEFQEFLNNATDIFLDLFTQKESALKNMAQYKEDFSKQKFIDAYTEFEIELADNILKYQDFDMIKVYVNKHLGHFYPYNNDHFIDLKKKLVDKDFEVEFLFRMIKNLDEFTQTASDFCVFDETPNPSKLETYFINTLYSSDSKQILDFLYDVIPVNNPQRDERFVFRYLQFGCDLLPEIPDKIEFIHDRLYDFKIWQIQHDVTEIVDSEKEFKYSKIYYPDFEKLCNIELERLNTKLKLLQAHSTSQQKTVPAVAPVEYEMPGFPLYWNASLTDLLELLTALFKVNAFKRKDGNDLNRTDLIAIFENLFGIEIKHVESKLTRATGRKIDQTPFINKLKLAFENYRQEKIDKLEKRK